MYRLSAFPILCDWISDLENSGWGREKDLSLPVTGRIWIFLLTFNVQFSAFCLPFPLVWCDARLPGCRCHDPRVKVKGQGLESYLPPSSCEFQGSGFGHWACTCGTFTYRESSEWPFILISETDLSLNPELDWLVVNLPGTLLCLRASSVITGMHYSALHRAAGD